LWALSTAPSIPSQRVGRRRSGRYHTGPRPSPLSRRPSLSSLAAAGRRMSDLLSLLLSCVDGVLPSCVVLVLLSMGIHRTARDWALLLAPPRRRGSRSDGCLLLCYTGHDLLCPTMHLLFHPCPRFLFLLCGLAVLLLQVLS
jgi:hypothetical protein